MGQARPRGEGTHLVGIVAIPHVDDGVVGPGTERGLHVGHLEIPRGEARDAIADRETAEPRTIPDLSLIHI